MPRNSEHKYLVYAYAREKDDDHGKIGSYYYIGKGTKRRPYTCSNRKIKCPKNRDKNVHILCKNLQEETAYSLEKFLIAHYGRVDTSPEWGILLNKTDGGEGARGTLVSEETREKKREKMKGENHPMFGKHLSEETKKKISQANSGKNHWMYGKKHSEETIEKLRMSKLGDKNPMFGVKMSEENRQKLRERMTGENNHMFGVKMSEESRRKMSESRKGEKHPMFGKHHSEETKRKISEAQKGEKGNMYGKKHTEKTKKKMSESRRGEKHPMFGKNHKEETKNKIRDSLLKPQNPSRKPRDWKHPGHGVVLNTPICELIRMFPEQNLKSPELSNLAKSKARSHRGWVCLNPDTQ